MNDENRALLADFGLMQILSDPSTVGVSTSSMSVNGTKRWMAPELLNPEAYGQDDCMFSKKSDIYALGMVIFEVSLVVFNGSML